MENAHTHMIENLVPDSSRETRSKTCEKKRVFEVENVEVLKPGRNYEYVLLLTEPFEDGWHSLAVCCPKKSPFSNDPPDPPTLTVEVVIFNKDRPSGITDIKRADYWEDRAIDKALASFSRSMFLFRLPLDRFRDPAG